MRTEVKSDSGVKINGVKWRPFNPETKDVLDVLNIHVIIFDIMMIFYKYGCLIGCFTV
jgi:hypothetical protein